MNAQASVVDVTVETFQKEVVERSRQVPVLIDFWATWCGPCKALTPVLEKLARELAGKFVLAKVDIDANPEIADLFQVQSVPTVMLVKGARPVDGFMGAVPEAKVRKFLETHLGVAAPSPMEAAAALEGQGKRAEAAELLRAHLQEQVGDFAARTTLARLLVADGRVEEAKKVFAKLAGEALETPEAKAVAAQIAAAAKAGEVAGLEAAVARDPKDVAARIALGKGLVAAAKYERGLEELLTAAKLDLQFDGGAPRKAMIEVFNLLGQSDPLVLDYQRRLSMLLCV
jgi:putative thioredoxin